jgi:hypothetical protein
MLTCMLLCCLQKPPTDRTAIPRFPQHTMPGMSLEIPANVIDPNWTLAQVMLKAFLQDCNCMHAIWPARVQHSGAASIPA